MNLCGNPLVFSKLLFSTKWLVWLFQRSSFPWKATLLLVGITVLVFKRHSVVYIDIWFWKREFITGTFLEEVQSASQGPALGLCKERGVVIPLPVSSLGGCGGRAALWLPSLQLPDPPYRVGQLQLAAGKAVPWLWGKERPKRAGSNLFCCWEASHASFLSPGGSWCSPWSWSQHPHSCPQQVTAELKSSQRAPFTLLQWSGIDDHFSLLNDSNRLSFDWVICAEVQNLWDHLVNAKDRSQFKYSFSISPAVDDVGIGCTQED